MKILKHLTLICAYSSVNDLHQAYHGPCFSSSSLLLSPCPLWRCCCVGTQDSTSLSWLHLQVESHKRETTHELYSQRQNLSQHVTTSCNAYWKWGEENIIWILLKRQSFPRQTDWWNTRARLAHPFNQNLFNCIHIHFSAYMNGAAQYSSYQKLMVSTLRLFPVMTPGSSDITAFSCRPSMTKHCCIITLPTAVSDRRQFNCLF